MEATERTTILLNEGSASFDGPLQRCAPGGVHGSPCTEVDSNFPVGLRVVEGTGHRDVKDGGCDHLDQESPDRGNVTEALSLRWRSFRWSGSPRRSSSLSWPAEEPAK